MNIPISWAISMTRVLIVIFSFINCILFSGCIFDFDTTESKDKGTYTIEAEPRSVQSYPGGGGLFILSMEPGDNFGGDVWLTLDASPGLNAKLTTDLLSLDKRVAEVEIRPDSTIAIGAYTLKVISEHAGVKNELNLSIEIFFDTFCPPDLKFIEFVQWVEGKYPQFVFEDGEKWFSYFKYPGYDGASTWIFLSPTLEITILYPMVPSPSTYYYLFRKRGETEPIFAAKKEQDVAIHEIPVDEFGK